MRTTFSSCVSNCDQGRKPCTSPKACGAPDTAPCLYPIGCPDELKHPADCDQKIGWGAFIPAFLALALVALCAALVLMLRDFSQ